MMKSMSSSMDEQYQKLIEAQEIIKNNEKVKGKFN